MRSLLAAATLAIGIAPAFAQTLPDPTLGSPPQTKPNISATGRTMPPVPVKDPGGLKPSTEAEMIKAQKAAEARNKAWDSRMRKTMGSICTGC